MYHSLEYSDALDKTLSVAGNVAGAFESGAAIGTLQSLSKIPLSTAKAGLGMTKALGTAGVFLTGAVAIHEFATSHDNTHTWVIWE